MYRKEENIKIGIVVLIIGIIFLMNITYENNELEYYENKIYPTTKLNGIDISDLDIKDLNKKLNSINDELKEKEIKIKTEKDIYSISLKELGYKSNIDELEEDIKTYGREEDRLGKLEIINNKDEKKYCIDLNIDNNKLNTFLQDVYKKTLVGAKNPKVTVENNKVHIVSGKEGKYINLDKVTREIENRINDEVIPNLDIEINAIYDVEKMDYTEDELKQIDSKISTFITPHGSSAGRKANLINAASKINNKVVLPGQTFSYTDTVGPVEMSNGYKSAPVIVNGELVSGIGGGICQVSSTMYNTQLRAGILPTERRNHSKAVAYVAKGLDATVASGVIDYKFKNTLEYPILVQSYVTNSEVVVEFWSNVNATNNITYEPKSYISGNRADTYLYGYDNSGKKVYEEYVDSSSYR